jgi:tungstate transport system ATP-binding protein
MKEIVYHLQDIRKIYDSRCVLQVDSLDIYRGEAFAIVGPSGSGKSTLLRLLNFLESPSEGSIHYRESEFSAQQDMPIHLRRQVTTVFQTPILLNRSLWANVQFGLQLRGLHNSHHRTEEALKKVGLDELAQHRARTLSGGEAQRVALARAMVLRPEVLLLDEPTANLDPYNVNLIEDTVQKINHEQGTTIVMVTHNVFQARRMAHRVAFLLNGKIIEIADVDNFFQNPKDPRTTAFVRGDMVY